MSCLEDENCDIDQLNAEMVKLQAMQHKYSLIEHGMVEDPKIHEKVPAQCTNTTAEITKLFEADQLKARHEHGMRKCRDKSRRQSTNDGGD